MTISFTTRLAALIHRFGSAGPSPGDKRQAPAQPGLAALNKARRGAVRHPSMPAYRQRGRAARPDWPFPAGGTHGTGD